ncbi:MAG: DrmB family protein [Actinomycetota bacterium]
MSAAPARRGSGPKRGSPGSPGQPRRSVGQLRRSQVITTYGPGALIDLPDDAAIVGGLETWPPPDELEEIDEPRLRRKLAEMTGVPAPLLLAPPVPSAGRYFTPRIGIYRFPQWFVVQEEGPAGAGSGRRAQDDLPTGREGSRRLVPAGSLEDDGRFRGNAVVATRFVRACTRGHIDDLNWRLFVHPPGEVCRRQLWLDERGSTGDLGDLFVRCECGRSRGLAEATVLDGNPLGSCPGTRPWLGNVAPEDCTLPSRLLTRAASNAYFPQVVSALALPERLATVTTVVRNLWDSLAIVENPTHLEWIRGLPKVAAHLAGFGDDEVLAAIDDVRRRRGGEQPVKHAELEAITASPAGFGDDVPVDANFHTRRLPDNLWRRSDRTAGIEAVFQLHRLREVRALIGFTRFDAESPDIDGEFATGAVRAPIARDPSWFPAVENRGEGLLVLLRSTAVARWITRPAVEARVAALDGGYQRFARGRRPAPRPFPGGPYILLHTLSHLLVQSLAMVCGYPASSIRERIYADYGADRFGLLLYTASPDAEGTLGGLVQQARYLEDHLALALRQSALCSNDPICAQHVPGDAMDTRWLLGAACHGCALIAETSCEMRNDYLDRALVTPVLGVPGAAFFPGLP